MPTRPVCERTHRVTNCGSPAVQRAELARQGAARLHLGQPLVQGSLPLPNHCGCMHRGLAVCPSITAHSGVESSIAVMRSQHVLPCCNATSSYRGKCADLLEWPRALRVAMLDARLPPM